MGQQFAFKHIYTNVILHVGGYHISPALDINAIFFLAQQDFEKEMAAVLQFLQLWGSRRMKPEGDESESVHTVGG